MMTVNQFKFHLSALATTPPPQPEDNPIQHILPPEPLLLKPKNSPQVTSYHNSTPDSLRQEADVTLGNSPQFSAGPQPQRPIKSISHFNKKIGDSIKRNIFSDQQSPRAQKSIESIEKRGSRLKQLNATLNRDPVYSRPKEHYSPHAMTQRQKKSQRVTSVVNTDRTDKFGSRYCEACNPKLQNSPSNRLRRKTPNTKDYDNDPQKEILLEKMLEIRNKMDELENVNTHQSAELTVLREKLRERELECGHLRSKYDQYFSLSQTEQDKLQKSQVHHHHEMQQLQTHYKQELQKLKKFYLQEAQLIKIQHQKEIETFHQESSHQKSRFNNSENEVSQLKKINSHLSTQINQLKKQVSYYQNKNGESLQLLQKLNQNISQRQQILQKQLNEQKVVTANLAEEKNKIEVQSSQYEETLKSMEEQRTRYYRVIEQLRVQNERLRNIIDDKKQSESKSQNNVEQQKKINEELKSQLKSTEYQMTKAEQKSIIILKELRMKQEDYDKLQSYTEQLRKQKEESIQESNQEKRKSTTNFQKELFELKTVINSKNQELEQITYEYRQLEMKMMVQVEENNKNMTEIDDLKQQKKIVEKQRQGLREEITTIVEKNSQLNFQVEKWKQKQVELNVVISNYQKELIQSEENNNEHIKRIAALEIELKQANQVTDLQRRKLEKYQLQIVDQSRIISTLQDNLKKENKVVLLYKEGLAKLQDKKEVEWNNMNKVYIQQIKRLQETIRELMEYNDFKRTSKLSSFKSSNRGNVSFSYHSPGKSGQLSKVEAISEKSDISVVESQIRQPNI